MPNMTNDARAGLLLLWFVGTLGLVALSARQLVDGRAVDALCLAILAACNWALAGLTAWYETPRTSLRLLGKGVVWFAALVTIGGGVMLLVADRM